MKLMYSPYTLDELEEVFLAHPLEDTALSVPYMILPDTSLLRDNRPFFMPHLSTHISPELMFVVRISKIGKQIEPQFAERYYTQIGIGLVFVAQEVRAEAKAQGLPWDYSLSFDQSTVISSLWDLNPKQTLTYELQANGETVAKTSLRPDFQKVLHQLIASWSKSMNYKMGDLFLIPLQRTNYELVLGDTLKTLVNNQIFSQFSVL